jgi:hypothetical protein
MSDKNKLILVLVVSCVLIAIIGIGTKISRDRLIENMTPVERVINDYARVLVNKQWDEFVSLFDSSEEEQNDLLIFLKDENNTIKREGIHGIKSIEIRKIEPTTSEEFSSKGDMVYDVYLDMLVANPSEFYENGVSLHVFVFKNIGDKLLIDTVYYRGLTQLP